MFGWIAFGTLVEEICQNLNVTGNGTTTSPTGSKPSPSSPAFTGEALRLTLGSGLAAIGGVALAMWAL